MSVGQEITSPSSEEFELKPGDRKHVELVVPALPAATAIRGRIVDSQRQPVVGARVWLRDWDLGANRQASGRVTEVLTGADGGYAFHEVEPGGHRVEVRLSGRAVAGHSDAIDIEAGKVTRIDLIVDAPR